MSSPVLVTIAGVGGLICLPAFERLAAEGTINLATLKTANAVAYAIQLAAVSIPGRIDGQIAKEMASEGRGEDEGGGKNTIDDGIGKKFTPRDGRTLVAPAGWAFAIWGPIFLGELIFVAVQARVSESSPLAPVLRQVSVPFAMAQYFQSLWCAAFRPKYKGRLMYISTGLLGTAAYSLSRAHAAFTSPTPGTSRGPGYGLLFLPLSMHFGWTTAATLVNLNGSISMLESTSDRTVALVGHMSAAAATATGVFVTLTRSAPTFGVVVSWALFACADGMSRRIAAAKEKEDDAVPGLYEAETQRRLCWMGACTSLGAALFIGVRRALRLQG